MRTRIRRSVCRRGRRWPRGAMYTRSVPGTTRIPIVVRPTVGTTVCVRRASESTRSASCISAAPRATTTALRRSTFRCTAEVRGMCRPVREGRCRNGRCGSTSTLPAPGTRRICATIDVTSNTLASGSANARRMGQSHRGLCFLASAVRTRRSSRLPSSPNVSTHTRCPCRGHGASRTGPAIQPSTSCAIAST